jgi:tetratricopeptide (TPR) repeat protein
LPYALADLHRYEEALAAFDRAILLDPNDARAYFNKGIVLDDLKSYANTILATNIGKVM